MGKSKPIEVPSPITGEKIKQLAGLGTSTPSKLTTKQVQELAASVLAHIEPRSAPKPKSKPKAVKKS